MTQVTPLAVQTLSAQVRPLMIMREQIHFSGPKTSEVLATAVGAAQGPVGLGYRRVEDRSEECGGEVLATIFIAAGQAALSTGRVASDSPLNRA